MGRCSPLVGLRSSTQSVDQLALLFREFWRVSWRFRGAMSLTSSAYPGSRAGSSEHNSFKTNSLPHQEVYK